MSRPPRPTRSTALLSAATLAAAAAFALAFAPSAAADIPAPPLGSLSVDNDSPMAGDSVLVSGDGCFDVPVPAAATSSDASAADATTAAPAAPAAAGGGSVSVTISGPDSFQSNATADASVDGSWTADDGITLGDGGSYTVSATCTLTDPILGQSATFRYDSITLDVSDPAPVLDPTVVCSNGCAANPGDTVSVGGNGFASGATATITLAGYGSKTAHVDSGGVFDAVSFVIAAKQAAATLAGTVTAAGVPTQNFRVTVTVPTQPGGGDVDGTVPGNDTTGGGTDTDTDTGTTGDADAASGGTTTTSAPTLPATGTDSFWPGVIGGLLVLTGGGLLWVSRRRDEVDITA